MSCQEHILLAGDDCGPEREDPLRGGRRGDRGGVQISRRVGRLQHAVPRPRPLPGRLPRPAIPQRPRGEQF